MAEKKYIEVEAYLDRLEEVKSVLVLNENDPFDDGVRIGIERAMSEAETIPAADMRPVVRGEWIWKKSGEVVCSKCNDLMAIVGNTEDLITVKSYHNFCPNCGADMREK